MKTALITGANSGFGLETARLLGRDESYTRIVLAVRSDAKGQATKKTLVEAVGGPADRFEVLVVDVSSVRSVRDALATFRGPVDLLIVNAGMVGRPTLEHSPDGVELSYAASLTGHFVMTSQLLERGDLPPRASIVISGAEAARGDVAGMPLYDVRSLAPSFGGELVPTMVAMARGEVPATYDPRANLSTLKAFAAWWGAALARRVADADLPVRVLVVSPGGAPGTNGKNNLPAPMRMFLRVLTPLMVAFGQAHSPATGARRYLDALALPEAAHGRFFASAVGKNTGPLVDNTALVPHLADVELQEAAFAALVELTGESPSLSRVRPPPPSASG